MPPAKGSKRDPKTRQIRTIAKNAGKSVPEVKRLLRRHGVTAADGTPNLNTDTRVDIQDAIKALGAPRTENEAPPPESPLAKLDAAASGTLAPAPAVSGLGSGNEDDPIPQDILEGTMHEDIKAFPMPTKPRKDFVYWPINLNPNRQNTMTLRGWRFVTNMEHIMEIRPDGLYKRMRTPTGRVRYKDLELACLPVSVAVRRRKQRQKEEAERLGAHIDTFKENVEDTRQQLRDKMGPGMGKHIEVYEEDTSEAEGRAAHKPGQRTTVDLGS